MNTTRTLDDALQDFYRAEMPDPWPAMRAPARTVALPLRRVQRPWLRSVGRLALAASIAFLLLGYLALASLFPPQTERSFAPDSRPFSKQLDGPRPPVKQNVPLLPSGNGATITNFPGGEILTPAVPEPRRR